MLQTMPPRSSLTSSFPTADGSNEVVCPLRNNDGSSCRKRCLGVSLPIVKATIYSFAVRAAKASGEPSTDKRMCAMQEKRYRSMQEHIRRAHPEHYISKLPATEESFFLMVNSTPSVRPPQPPVQSGPQQSVLTSQLAAAKMLLIAFSVWTRQTDLLWGQLELPGDTQTLRRVSPSLITTCCYSSGSARIAL